MSDENKLKNLSGIFENGYGYIPKKVMKDTSLSIESKAIYAYLAAYADIEGKAYPSVELICDQLVISENRFHKYKKELIKNGYISVERERKESGWSNNIYYLKGFSVSRQFVGIQNEGIENVGIQNVGLQNEVTNNITSNNITSNNITSNNITDKNNESNENLIGERFTELWKLYPNKKGKPSALKSYKKAIKDGVTDEEIKQGILSYTAEIKSKGTPKQYIKHGSTWFNNRGWEDEYDVPAASESHSRPDEEYDNLPF